MKYIINESQYKAILNEIEYNSEVAKVQKYLVNKGYYLGNYGPNGDGVDGKLGPLTKKALKKEFGKTSEDKQTNNTISKGDYDAILVGGLDNRPGDVDINTQVELLKKGIGQDKKVKGFRYNTSPSTIINFINNNSGVPVYLFSAGCKISDEISSAMGSNKNKLYIIEPYAAGQITKANVRSAVNGGVPSSNVFVGDSVGRGLGIVNGASSSGSPSHWGSLTSVGNKTK